MASPVENCTDSFSVQLLAAALSPALGRKIVIITDRSVDSKPGTLDIDGLAHLMYLHGRFGDREPAEGSVIRVNVKLSTGEKKSLFVKQHIVVEEMISKIFLLKINFCNFLALS